MISAIKVYTNQRKSSYQPISSISHLAQIKDLTCKTPGQADTDKYSYPVKTTKTRD